VVKSLQSLAQDWQALSPLLDEALALPTEDRAAWLERLGPQAEGLRPRLRELLDLQDDVRTRGFLEALPVLPGLQAPALAVQVGDQVGPYRLVDEIGRGGMGTVWLAERADGLLKRRCALKLPLLAWSDSLRDRMAQERDILAGLDHPHIARLLDTGVDDQGRPFLALEHVQGEPIDAWMDARKLPVRERVALFVQVVDAIRYAHANLVIHRDLKPSNILVTAQGQAKLLDFGIAKLLSDASAGEPSDLTLTGQRLLTPRYASPEQILGQRLTAASDVYSLGVLLHELLCGQPPYAAGKTPDKLPEQAVLEADVRAPSRLGADAAAAARRGTTPDKLVRQLRGELDAIVLRALARAPQERYSSAESLQSELLAWLEGRPVQARNPGPLAVAWKFVMRHRVATSGLLATLVMAIVAAGMAWKSEQEAERTGKARDFFLDILRSATPLRKEGREPSVRELLLEAEAAIPDRFVGQPALELVAQQEIARLWAGFGEHRKQLAALERRAAALASTGDAAALAETVLEQASVSLELLQDPEQARRNLDRFETISAQHKLGAATHFWHAYWRGWVEFRLSNFPESKRWFDRAHSQAGELPSPFPSALALRAGGVVAGRMGQWKESDQALMELSDLTRKARVGWDNAQLRAVRWELATDMLSRGKYIDGWSELQQLVQADEATYGRFNFIALREQTAWLQWCVRLRQEKLAASWLEARAAHLTTVAAPAPSGEWLLQEAQIYSLVGDNDRARERIQLARERGSSMPLGARRDELMFRVDEARARVAVAKGNVHELGQIANSMQAGDLHPGAGYASRRHAATRLQIQGFYARLQGDQIRAVAAFIGAAEELERLMGPAHPEVWALQLNLSMARWQLTRQQGPAQEAARSARALLGALPPEHPAALKASEVAAAFETWLQSEEHQASTFHRLTQLDRVVIFF
jgi:serine/threonine protein kinase